MTHSVVFAPEAQADLIAIYDYVASEGGTARALAFIERIETACGGLSHFPERGTLRDLIRPGVRVIGFEKRVAIAFRIVGATVTVDRILYGGRDLDQALNRR